jgi:aminomuconate-semialdehyde/2-hydroxymuconate-6-semialdehyde dehydrogenase
MAELQKLANYIGGYEQTPRNNQYFENFEPATGKAYSLVPDSKAEDIDAAVAAAREIYPWWSQRTPEQRSQVLLSIANRLEQSLGELAMAESRDQGMPLAVARELEIPRAIANFRYFGTKILHHEEIARPSGALGALSYTHRKPVGVAGLIVPFGLPLYLLTSKIAPAIASGNTVVCKPSELTPMTAYLLGEMLNEAGVPHGVVNIVLGGAAAGEALALHPEVPLLSFTGSASAGQRVLQAAAPRFKKTSIEVSGKNSALVFADADLSEAVLGTLRSAFQNQGEICLCNSRILVEESIYPAFLEKYLRMASLLRLGDPEEKETQVGPLVSRAQLEKVRKYIGLAQEEGGSVAFGGKLPSLPEHLKGGFFLEPTVITGLPLTAQALKQEALGPVVTINSFKNEKEAIALSNAGDFGLSATVWSRDISRAHRVAHALEAGTTWVNTWMQRDLAMPLPGAKFSSLAQEGGGHSLNFFSQTKTVCVKV